MLNGTVRGFFTKVWSGANMQSHQKAMAKLYSYGTFYIQISNLNTLIPLLFVWSNSDMM